MDWQPVLLTIELAAVTTVILLLLGTPLAWWLARSKARWKEAVERGGEHPTQYLAGGYELLRRYENASVTAKAVLHAAGHRVRVPVGRTIADGQQLETPGERTFPVVRKRVADVVTVLHKGRVLREGTIAEIERDDDVRRIYLGEA